jgi:hypothetical protein
MANFKFLKFCRSIIPAIAFLHAAFLTFGFPLAFELWPASAPSRQSGIKGHNQNNVSFPGSPGLAQGSSHLSFMP